MTTRLYYLMSFLPALPPLGEPPPITAEEVLKILQEESNKDIRFLAAAFDFESQLIKAAHVRLLGFSSGDTSGAFSFDPEMPPFVIDLFLKDPQEVGEDAWLTELWREHFDFIEGVGKNIASSLLCRWAQWERALREQLSGIRLRSESEAQAKEGFGGEWDHSFLLAEWGAAPDPMIGERLLDEARIRFIDEEAKRYTFGMDELAAYFLKLALLSRYARLNREEGVKILEEVTTL